jgi:hypothetical protein
MTRRSIRATTDTDIDTELLRVRQWCASSAMPEAESAFVLEQVANTLSELRSAALTASSRGSTFQATRNIKTTGFVIEVTLNSGHTPNLKSQLFKWFGL